MTNLVTTHLAALEAATGQKLLTTFSNVPVRQLPSADQATDVTVRDNLRGTSRVDHYVPSDALKARLATTPAADVPTAAVDLTPEPVGGWHEGDVVATTSDPRALVASGAITTVRDALTRGEFAPHQATVSHVGIVHQDPVTGEWRVIQMSRETPTGALAARLTPDQIKHSCFITDDPLSTFFGGGVVRGQVFRPRDAAAGEAAARKAEWYVATQATATETHPWYYLTPPMFAPDGRGGLCGTFDDLCYGRKFALPFLVTPEQFADTPDFAKVGDMQVVGLSRPAS